MGYTYEYVSHLTSYKECSEKDISYVEMRYARQVARQVLIMSRALGNRPEPSAVDLATARAAELYANHRAWIDPPLSINADGLDLNVFRMWVDKLYKMGAGRKPEKVTLSLGDIAGVVKESELFRQAVLEVGDYEYQDGSRDIKVLKVSNEYAVLSEIVAKIEDMAPSFFNYVEPVTKKLGWQDWEDYGNDPLEAMPKKKKKRVKAKEKSNVDKKDHRKGHGRTKSKVGLLGKGKVDKEWVVIARYRRIRGRRSGVRVRMREGCRPKRPSPRFF